MALLARLPRPGQTGQFDFDISLRSEIALTPGQNITSSLTQTGFEIRSSDLKLDADERAGLKALSFTSNGRWDAHCQNPRFESFKISDSSIKVPDFAFFERFLRVLDGDAIVCFPNAVQAGQVAFVQTRDIVAGELFGIDGSSIDGSTRVKIEAIGTFDGRDAILFRLFGGASLKSDNATMSGTYEGQMVIQTKSGIILALDSAVSMRGTSASGGEARISTTRTLRVRDIR